MVRFLRRKKSSLVFPRLVHRALVRLQPLQLRVAPGEVSLEVPPVGVGLGRAPGDGANVVHPLVHVLVAKVPGDAVVPGEGGAAEEAGEAGGGAGHVEALEGGEVVGAEQAGADAVCAVVGSGKRRRDMF